MPEKPTYNVVLTERQIDLAIKSISRHADILKSSGDFPERKEYKALVELLFDGKFYFHERYRKSRSK